MNKMQVIFKKTGIMSGLVVILLFSLIAAGCGQTTATSAGQAPAGNNSQPSSGPAPAGQTPLKNLSFGTSSTGSIFYALSVGMGNIFQKKAGINVAVEALGGSNANVAALKAKKIDLAMLNSMSISDAYNGTGTYAKSAKLPLRVLAQGQDSLRYLVVRNSAGIKSVADLKGKKLIGIRPSATDVELSAKAFLGAYGLTEKDVKMISTVEANEAINDMKDGTADAAIIQGAVGASNLMDLAQTTPITFLSLPDDKMDAVLKQLGPAFHKAVVPAGTFKGQTEAVSYPALTTALVVSDSFPEDEAYTLTKTLMESNADLKAVSAAGASWSLQNTLKNPPPAPFDNGAIKYFKEAGAWTPALDQQQQAAVKNKP